MKIPVLFARADSIYKSFPECDVWDIARDSLHWHGETPGIYHPPCRAWGQLRAFAKPRPGEKELALWSIEQIRKYGGVLEHPRGSTLWSVAGLPKPGQYDEFGGWTLPINQHWFGHKAEKATFLYIVGCSPKDIPDIPLKLDYPKYVVGQSRKRRHIPEISKSDRERTPIEFAIWLINLVKVIQIISAYPNKPGLNPHTPASVAWFDRSKCSKGSYKKSQCHAPTALNSVL